MGNPLGLAGLLPLSLLPFSLGLPLLPFSLALPLLPFSLVLPLLPFSLALPLLPEFSGSLCGGFISGGASLPGLVGSFGSKCPALEGGNLFSPGEDSLAIQSYSPLKS